jgi:glycosyltransferase involved in cell wall biosynthesis
MADTTEATARSDDPPWVTVLMPVFNGERYVAAAIESVLEQTHRQFELLILDDGSTDDTPRILADYAARDTRIRVFRHDNMDQPATLNRGLRLARHDWVAIMDHDDICMPDRLKRQLQLRAQEPEARVIGTWALEINSEGRVLRTRGRGATTVMEFRAQYASGGRIPLVHPSVLMHRPTILELGGYDPVFGPSADTELWTRVAQRHPIVVVPEPLIMYRIHSQSMSVRRLFEQRELLRCIMERDRARRQLQPVPSVAEFRAGRPAWKPRRWLDSQHDLFWFLRSHCLLAASERRLLRATLFGAAAALVSPPNAVRLATRRVAAIGGPRRAANATRGDSYRVVDLELTEPVAPVELSSEQNGIGLIGRWHGRIVGFALLPWQSGAVVTAEALRSLVDREFGRRVLRLRAQAAMQAAWARSGTPASPPPSRRTSLTVAICTRDRPASLSRLLESLDRVRNGSSFRSVEVLVVDNASTGDDTRAAVAHLEWATYLHEPRPGLNFARNAALHAASGDLLAFLDDDVVVDRHWLAGLYNAHTDCPEAGGFSGLVLPLRLDSQAQLEFERRGGFGRGFERIYHASASAANPLHPVGAGVVGAGCNMAFDRGLLLELGGFDEALDTGAPLPGGGDLDIFYRVLRAGRSIVYEPTYAVFHEHRETMSQLRRQYWSWGLGFMAFLAKARRADVEFVSHQRAMLRWWFLHQIGALAKSVLRFDVHRSRFVLAELRGGVRGVLGEYDRSSRRVRRIREHRP